jgi:hypothetical protein
MDELVQDVPAETVLKEKKKYVRFLQSLESP